MKDTVEQNLAQKQFSLKVFLENIMKKLSRKLSRRIQPQQSSNSQQAILYTMQMKKDTKLLLHLCLTKKHVPSAPLAKLSYATYVFPHLNLNDGSDHSQSIT